jgi:hypothetical protein
VREGGLFLRHPRQRAACLATYLWRERFAVRPERARDEFSLKFPLAASRQAKCDKTRKPPQSRAAQVLCLREDNAGKVTEWSECNLHVNAGMSACSKWGQLPKNPTSTSTVSS